MLVSMNLRVRKEKYVNTALGLAFSVRGCRCSNTEEENACVNADNRKYFLHDHSVRNYSSYKLTRGIFAQICHH